MKWYDTERGYFWLEGFSNEWFFLYVADINNDAKEEYILAGGGGSGAFLHIDAVYQKQGSRLVDIFDEIRVPMWRLVRGKDKEDYDSVECGEIIIKTKNNKTFFTLYEHARNRDAEGFKYFPPKKWKFLWENGHIQLLEYKGPT